MWRDTVTKTRERFNPRAPCGARRRITRGAQPVGVGISTHAPLAGRDRREKGLHTHNFDFNPRAPCGARPCLGVTRAHYIKFQPTRPLRGATAISKKSWQIHKFQPTRPLRGATVKLVIAGVTYGISTHAPLAGRDSKSVQITMHIFAITDKFQMLLHRMPPVRAFCSFLMQENHADFGCEPPK